MVLSERGNYWENEMKYVVVSMYMIQFSACRTILFLSKTNVFFNYRWKCATSRKAYLYIVYHEQ